MVRKPNIQQQQQQQPAGFSGGFQNERALRMTALFQIDSLTEWVSSVNKNTTVPCDVHQTHRLKTSRLEKIPSSPSEENFSAR